MTLLLLYLVKLSISLAVVWLFYQLILRKLTFYNHNRFYLLGYSLLAFGIPFVNIAPALQKNELTNFSMIRWIPVVYQPSAGQADSGLGVCDLLIGILLAGMVFMIIRLLLQLLSFRKIIRKATLIASKEVKIYQVNEAVIPFSFGNAVFINPSLHRAEELEEIIRHEFVHVKQRHSFDILFSEILCLLNWYNPFAWLIRAAIRQNLEFIADQQVLDKGADKKQYQYLLLKVIGNNQFSIASKFNFSSLKKRIAMMNKLQSGKRHLLRFLFILPVLALILVSFRKEISQTFSGRPGVNETLEQSDTIPPPAGVSAKGNKRVTGYPADRDSDQMQSFLKRNPAVKEIGWVYNRDNSAALLHIIKKDGSSDKYDLRDEQQYRAATDKYGELPLMEPVAPPPPPAAPGVPALAATPPAVVSVAGEPLAVIEVEGQPLIAPAPPSAPAPAAAVILPDGVNNISISNKHAVVKLRNGKKEEYNLNNPDQRKQFEEKYGRQPAVPAAPAGVEVIELRESPVPVIRPDASMPAEKEVPVLLETKKPGNIVYVVNGVLSTSEEANGIDPATIESVNVLKGTTAVTAYGEKAKEGAIQITTKSGQPLHVTVDTKPRAITIPDQPQTAKPVSSTEKTVTGYQIRPDKPAATTAGNKSN